jgi:O-antigen ligase
MRITTESGWRNNGIFISIVLMLLCLFASRAALSVSMILFFALTIFDGNLISQLKTCCRNLVLGGMVLLFLIPFVSGLWSTDLKEWSEVLRIKLPLLLFPVAFAGNWRLSEKQWRNISAIFLGLIFWGCCQSLLHYFQNPGEVHESYLRSGTIATPLENDHIRFSWLVTAALINCLLLRQMILQRKLKIVLLSLAVFFAIYLHILAARMGLFCFYLFLLLFALWMLFKNRSKKGAVLLLAFLFLLPLLAWLSLPSFQNRIKYVRYDLSNVQSNNYLPGSNDGARVLSLKAGWQVMNENFPGAGAGDLTYRINQWYAVHAPGLKNKFLPCSEVLVYGGYAGWAGVAVLFFALALPFFTPVKKHGIFWYCLNAIVVFSFVFDMSLEAQFGVFMYAVIVLWWWKWLSQPNANE